MPSLSRRQAKALAASTAPINIWYGSVRSSKTHASLWKFVRFMAARATRTVPSDGVVLVVGLSTNTVWRNIFQPLLTNSEFAAVAPFVEYRQNAPTGKLYGQEFSVVGGNNEASWLSIQGMTVAFCLGDEATGWPKSFWDMLVTRLSMPTSTMLVTCNPAAKNHYLREVIESGDPDIHVEKFLLRENPTLTPEYIKRLERMYTGVFYKRMILAEWVAAEGAVYEGFDPDLHVVKQVPELVDMLGVGIDYGTNHPTAGYALGLGVDGRLYVTHEWVPNSVDGEHKRLTDAELATSLITWLGDLPLQPKAIYADPAAASFHQELRQRGLPVAKAKNAVVDGIRTVDSLLMGGQLLIHNTCTHLIDELPSYRWDDKAAQRGEDKPIKEHDDHVDALRYSVFSTRHLWRYRVWQPEETTAV